MAWWRSQAAIAFLLSSCAFGEEAMDATVPDIGRRDVGIDASSPDASNDPTDASDAGSDEPRVEVGTGSTQFEPLTEGQVVDFIAGPQGGGQFFGFHIWFGARTWNLNPE